MRNYFSRNSKDQKNLFCIYMCYCLSPFLEEWVFAWWSHFTRVLPLMGFYPASCSYRYFILTTVRMMESPGSKERWICWSPFVYWHQLFLDMISCCAEPSLCSGGSCARASPWRTDLGHVCSTRREDLPHCCPHGGSGTTPTESRDTSWVLASVFCHTFSEQLGYDCISLVTFAFNIV